MKMNDFLSSFHTEFTYLSFQFCKLPISLLLLGCRLREFIFVCCPKIFIWCCCSDVDRYVIRLRSFRQGL